MSDVKVKNQFWASVASVIDKTILFSFSKPGYMVRQLGFNPDDLDHSMQGKVCVITGGNSGIGRATAKALAQRGAEVWILCRRKEKGLEAVDQLREETKNHHIQSAVVDISDLDSVQKFCETFLPKRVDVLVHNAGAMFAKKATTPQALEQTFATLVAGPFLLTMGLLDRLKASEDARVIFVSSGGMYAQKLRLDRLLGEHEPYSDLVAYAQSKRAQVVLSKILAKKLENTSITVHAMHPGWVDTPGVRSGMPKFYWAMKLMLRTPSQGADTVVWLAVCPEVKKHSGKFWFDRLARPTHLLKSTKESKIDRKDLWHLCRDLVRSRVSVELG